MVKKLRNIISLCLSHITYRLMVQSHQKQPHNVEKILSRARGFMKLEGNSHYWGNVTERKSRKETSRRVERDKSIMLDSKSNMQRGKAQYQVGLGRIESKMIKHLRSYDCHD